MNHKAMNRSRVMGIMVTAVIVGGMIGYLTPNARVAMLQEQVEELKKDQAARSQEFYEYKVEFSRIQKQNIKLWIELNNRKGKKR
jgi:hypothetical protein